MDWIKQNKFLSSFLLVLLVAGGALGFLAFTATGTYQAAYGEYQTKVNELNALQTQTPFPEEANVKKLQEVEKAHQAAIESLQKDLVKAQIPLKKDLTPEKFQDNLRDAVRRVTAKATERNIPLKDGFYLGFESYQALPPKPEAAAPLGRMLEAIELAINILLDSKISALEEIKRDTLPEEGVAAATQETSTKPAQGGKDKDKDSALVQRHGFQVVFVSAEYPFRSFLNGLISNKQQFFIPTSVSIKSEMEKGPSKSEGSGDPRPPEPPHPDPNNPKPPVPPRPEGAKKFVVGDEKLKIALRVEIANFTEPTPAK